MEFIKRAASLMLSVVIGKAGAVGPVGTVLQCALQGLVISQFGMGWLATIAVSALRVVAHVAVAFLLGYVTVLRVASLNHGGGRKAEYPLSAQLKNNAILGGCLNLMLGSVVFSVVTLFTGGWSAIALLLASAVGGTLIDVGSVASFFASKKNEKK
ncbi:MAG: hypothetical protein K2W95_05705 [Candidatus Obscuribacterales bacterium]|nr:hypothetical protein [Candidatus Obscuribacterales bacterium]